MRRLVLGLLCVATITSVAVAGTETYSGKEMKQVAPPPCPQWYADNEFNVSLWGTYLFPGNSWANDRYLQAANAWGGGGDFKYFFHRYFGVGIEGWAVDTRRAFEDVFIDPSTGVFDVDTRHERRVVGSVLGTLTLRYPIPCTRFSPYIFGGGGGIFGGGEKTNVVAHDGIIRTEQTGSESRAIGQVGGGIEVRFTPHIGWVNDFSWNFVDGPHNNFGMVRSGINFAF
ncbi:MAG TPA: hypothetical protein VLQ29_01085 [Candidatus Dormibacteraeota bacterium]|nr:hypothetical protein [Candidatus Dormibacteraeota bacterium]